MFFVSKEISEKRNTIIQTDHPQIPPKPDQRGPLVRSPGRRPRGIRVQPLNNLKAAPNETRPDFTDDL